MGAYQYALKMFVYQRVRARNFARAWSFVQASQALPLACGIPLAGASHCLFPTHTNISNMKSIVLAGFLNTEYGPDAAYYASSAFVLSGSLALFAIDLRKYVLSRYPHSHKHQHRRKPRADGANRPRTPRVASEPNTDGAAGGSGVGEGVERLGVDGVEAQTDDEDDEEEVCPPTCKVCFIFAIVFLIKLDVKDEEFYRIEIDRVAFEKIHWPRKKFIFHL